MKKSVLLILSVIALLSTSRCAKRGSPSGGPKDSLPPVLVSATPAHKTVNFDADRVVMVFDEYVQLKSVADQLIVSPPLDRDAYTIYPEGTVSKKIELRLNEPPRKNTTFNFNFGASIVDYNEGNAFPFFSYTFSTGDYLDSLELSGIVKNAYAIDPPSRVSIHLYPIDSTFTDSTIYFQKPLYVGNTLDSVYFNLQSLAPGKYEFLAIQDVSNNYYFDQNMDKIGFFETPIELPQDSLKFPLMFFEVPNFKWGQGRFVNDHHLEFSYFGAYEQQQVVFDSAFVEQGQGFFTRDRKKDTLHYWFQPIEGLDSLQLGFKIADSIRPQTIKPFRLVEDSLLVNIQPQNGSIIHFTDTLKIESNLPITAVDEKQIALFDVDTLDVPFTTSIDENKDRVYIHFDKVQNDTYRLQLFPNAVTDFLGATNDTIMHQVRTQSVESYGTLFLTVKRKDPDIPYFFELMTEDGKLIRKIPQNASDFYSLDYLIPQKYQIRFVKDRNGNGRWDTGNYLEKRQPEEVIYLEEALNLRANWELNETITIE